MYADTITDSMRAAIDETNRRRALQQQYNEAHGITPQTIKKAVRDLIILGAVLGIWYASGTAYMQTLVVGGELQVSKVLPVLFGGAAILGFVIYLLFGRSD